MLVGERRLNVHRGPSTRGIDWTVGRWPVVEVDGGTEPGKCFCRREAKAPTVGLGIFKHEPDIDVVLCRDAYLIGKLRYPVGGKGDEDETGLGRAYEVDEHLTCQPDGDLGRSGRSRRSRWTRSPVIAPPCQPP